jgi:hypothetical protein
MDRSTLATATVAASSLFAFEERGDSFVDASLSRLVRLCRVDRVEVITLEAVRQRCEEGSGNGRFDERCFEVGWYLDFSRW